MYSSEDVLQEALQVKQKMDKLILGEFKLSDYWDGTNYVDEDGCVISEAEAQAEVDWKNR